MELFLEILKITIPAAIVFATVYYMLKQFFGNQLALRNLELTKNLKGEVLPLKLQAYERLMLFCDRITPQSLIYRLNANDMTAGGLHHALLIGIQHEYEHNLAQQIYVSDALWEIISLAKTEVQAMIAKSADNVDLTASSNVLVQEIMQMNAQFQPMKNAKAAIKEEIKIIL